MSVSGVGAASFAAQYSVSVAKSALDNQKVQGESALQLIDGAKSAAPVAPPPKPGHSLSVIA